MAFFSQPPEQLPVQDVICVTESYSNTQPSPCPGFIEHLHLIITVPLIGSGPLFLLKKILLNLLKCESNQEYLFQIQKLYLLSVQLQF